MKLKKNKGNIEPLSLKVNDVTENSEISQASIRSSIDLPKAPVINSQNLKPNKELIFKKTLIRALDVIASIFIISGMFIAQFENENYFDINKSIRNVTLKVVNRAIKGKSTNFTNYFKNYTNLTEADCNYFANQKYDKLNYTLINCPLNIDDYSMHLRIALLVTSIISILFLSLSKYYEFKVDYEYKKKLKGILLLIF